jgi:putative Mn2+ efflux pump MntP
MNNMKHFYSTIILCVLIMWIGMAMISISLNSSYNKIQDQLEKYKAKEEQRDIQIAIMEREIDTLMSMVSQDFLPPMN